MGKISALIKNLLLLCMFFLTVSCTASTQEKVVIDENVLFGKWIADQKPITTDRLDECIFRENYKYICFSYPPKGSGSDLTIDYRGRFSVVNNKLFLYHEKDEVLNLDERLMQSFEIFNLDDDALVLMDEDKKFIYKRLTNKN